MPKPLARLPTQPTARQILKRPRKPPMRQLMSLRKPLLLPKQPKRLLKRFPQSNSMAHRDMTLSAGLIGPLLLLTACDSAGGSRGGPGAVSEGEARALDEPAQMLEERRLPEGALPSEAT